MFEELHLLRAPVGPFHFVCIVFYSQYITEVGKYERVQMFQMNNDQETQIRAAEKVTNSSENLSYESCCRYLGGNNMGQAFEL